LLFSLHKRNHPDAGGVDAPISDELLACVHTLSPNETELARLLRGGADGDDDGVGGGPGGPPTRTESDAEVEAAATLLPALRSLAARDPGGYGPMLPEAWERLWQGKVVAERPRQSAEAAAAAAAAGGVVARAAEESGGRGRAGTDDEADEIENDDDEGFFE